MLNTCYLTGALKCSFLPDENECASGGHRCDTNAQCGNIIGSYFCQCYQGFNGDGHSCFGGLAEYMCVLFIVSSGAQYY